MISTSFTPNERQEKFIEFCYENSIAVAPFTISSKGYENIGIPFSYKDAIDSNLRNIVPEEQGIYKLFDDNGLLYIGMATNLQKRLTQHLRSSRFSFKYVFVFIMEEYTLDRIRKIESNMIKYFMPPMNTNL